MSNDARLDHIKNMARLSNQMATQHSILHDRLAKRALRQDLCLMVLSGTLVFLSVAKTSYVSAMLGWVSQDVDGALLIALLSFALFLISISEWRVDWKGRANSHKSASKAFAQMRREMKRIAQKEGAIDDEEFRIATERYDVFTESAPNIPEHDFNWTKRRHKLKVLESRFMDLYPGANPLLVRVRIRWRDNRGKLDDI